MIVEELNAKYKRALDGGRDMLVRATELNKIADKIILETGTDFENVGFVQALTIKVWADEMRIFYNKMFD